MVKLHNKFTHSPVKELIEGYLRKLVERKYILWILGISKIRFFALIKLYRRSPDKFLIRYARCARNRHRDFAYDKASSLPHGLQRKLEIARTIATGPKLLFLDEPAAGMNLKKKKTL